MKYFNQSHTSTLSISQKNRVVESFMQHELTKKFRVPKDCFRHIPDDVTRLDSLLKFPPVRLVMTPLERLIEHLEYRKGFWGVLMRFVLRIVASVRAARDLYRRMFPYAPRIKITEWLVSAGNPIHAGQPVFKYVFVSRFLRIPCRKVRKFYRTDESAIFARLLVNVGQSIRPDQPVFTFIPEACFAVVAEVAKTMPLVEEAEAIMQADLAGSDSLPLSRKLPPLDNRLRTLNPDTLPPDDEQALLAHCSLIYERFGVGETFIVNGLKRLSEEAQSINANGELDPRVKRMLTAKIEQKIQML